MAVLSVLLLAAACSRVVEVGTRGDRNGPAGSPTGHALAARHRVTASIAVGDRPVGLAVAYGAVWVANHGEGTVSRIDPAVDQVVATIRVGQGPGRLMAVGGAVWVTDDRDGLVWRIDPSTNRARSIDVGGRVSGAPAAGKGSIWVTVWDDARLVRIEPATGRVMARTHTLVQPLGVQFADGSLWIANSIDGAGKVTRVDPVSQRILATFILGRFPWFQSADEGGEGLWVADGVAGRVYRIDPKSDRVVAAIGVGDLPVSFGAPGEAWVNLSTSLSRIDAGTNQVAESMPIGGSPGGVAVGLGAVWVAGLNADTVWRIEPGSL